jgi:prepilin-type N-terminal cleavage/methylation domain-containing protein
MIHRRSEGFTLLEVLVVLGIIAGISAIILPNLGLNPGSQMSLALRDLTNSVRATYDNAVLTGRVHRLVLNFEKSEYWAEAAPLGYEGRPPQAHAEGFSASQTFKEDARKRLLEELDKSTQDPRKPQDKEDKAYSQRSFLIAQRSVLNPVSWSEINDAVLYKRTLPGSVVFAAAATEGMTEKVTYEKAEEKEFAFVYFFPQGEVQQAVIQLALQLGKKEIQPDGPKFTLILDPLTGHSQILEGLQDPEFLKEGK